MSRKKSISSAGTPIRPDFGLVSRIYPDIVKLRYFTVRILILICILYIRKIAGGRGSVPDPAGGAQDAPQTPKFKLDPRRLGNVTLAPYDSRLRRGLRRPNYGHLMLAAVNGLIYSRLQSANKRGKSWLTNENVHVHNCERGNRYR